MAKKIAVQIEQDIVVGQFDSTLETYKPTCILAAPVVVKTLVEYFEDWVKDYRNMSCDKDADYHSTRSMMRKWGSFTIDSVISHLGKENIAAVTYNRRLCILKAFFQWAAKRGGVTENPLEDVISKKVKKKTIPSRKPFTPDEIQRILAANYCNFKPPYEPPPLRKPLNISCSCLFENATAHHQNSSI